jgi:hypothetical protein
MHRDARGIADETHEIAALTTCLMHYSEIFLCSPMSRGALPVSADLASA